MLLASTSKTNSTNIANHLNQSPFANNTNQSRTAGFYKNINTSTISNNSNNHNIVGGLPELVSQKYQIHQIIGQGGFGTVYSAFRKKDNLKVAIKIMKKNKLKAKSLLYDELSMSYVPKEVYLLRRISHPNFIKLYELLEDNISFYMVTEMFGKQWNINKQNNCMDLFECMESVKLSQTQIKHIFKQIMSGLMYLKSLNLYHSDIKDENILIDEDLNIKIIDFGSCQLVPEKTSVSTFRGTIDYASPEILLNKKYFPELADVWSLGFLFHVMLYGKQPFNKLDEILIDGYKVPKRKGLSDECMDLLFKMLSVDDRKRATFNQIIQHPWFK